MLNGAKLTHIVVACTLSLLLASTGYADSDDNTVVVKEGQSLRDIAAEYLGNADLWGDILRMNHLGSVTEAKPGMRLTLPRTAVVQATTALAEAQETIQAATTAGASLFAADLIKSATEYLERAQAARKSSDWAACARFAKGAKERASQALQKSAAQKDVTADATVHDCVGTVEVRKETGSVWKDAPAETVLVEGDRIRTLSAAHAEVRFRDGSRLRLNENSQAVIQRMRMNLLEQKAESSVSLISGDAFALLDGNHQRRQFNLKLANSNAQIKVRSSKFWVAKDSKKTRFANYDGELEVSSTKGSVVLKENQGSMMDENGKPSAPKALLASPEVVGPAVDAEISTDSALLSWKAVPQAVSYWVEVSSDRAFKKTVDSKKAIKGTTLSLTHLRDGPYYWRVASVDSDDFPGPKSEPRLFRINNDKLPPFLLVRGPDDGAVVSQADVRTWGEVEAGSQVLLNDKKVSVGADGTFDAKVPVAEGTSTLTIVARDAAGNETVVKRKVTLLSHQPIAYAYDANIPIGEARTFLSSTPTFTLRGVVPPLTTLAFALADQPSVVAVATADPNGLFSLNLPMHEPTTRWRVSGKSPDGRAGTDIFSVMEVQAPPTLDLDEEPASSTADDKIVVTGRVDGAQELQINASSIPLADGVFRASVPLKPGHNAIDLVAKDSLGQRTQRHYVVLRDQEAPKLVRYQITPERVDGDTVIVRVTASDLTGLKKTAPFTIRVGTYVHTGYLKLLRAEHVYQAAIRLPKTVKGHPVLKMVQLVDYLGNQLEYRPQ